MPIHGEAAVWGAFCADALALGAHWVYDPGIIEASFGRLERFEAPLPDTFHPGKKAGDFTHYGDQMLWLLDSIADCGGFDLNHFADFWRAQWHQYQGYLDQATKQTLQNMATGRSPAQSGSASDDLSGATRIAPVILALGNAPDALVQAAQMQTAMTHNHPDVIMAAEWLVRLIRQMQHEELRTAISSITDSHFHNTPLANWVDQGLMSTESDTRTAIAELGQSCSIRGAFPSMVHLLAKYETDVETALVENTMAGGDSASRGMGVGLVLGAHLGMSRLPAKWLNALTHRDHIDGLLKRWNTNQS